MSWQSSTFWSFGSNEIFPARPVPAAVETNAATWSISVGGQLVLEGRHPVAAVRDLSCDLLLVRAHLVEVRADLPGRPRGLQRVAAAAALGGEDLLTGAARSGGILRSRIAAAAASATDGEEGQHCDGHDGDRHEDDRGRGDSTHSQNIEAESPVDRKRVPTGRVAIFRRGRARIFARHSDLQRGGHGPGARATGSRGSWTARRRRRGDPRRRRVERRQLRADAGRARRRSAVQAAPAVAQLRAPDRGHGRARRRGRKRGDRDGRGPSGPARGGARARGPLARRLRRRLRGAREAGGRNARSSARPPRSSTASSAG